MANRTTTTRRTKYAQKKYAQMTPAELDEATREFDREFAGETFGPLNKRGRALHRQAARRAGRPKVGKGAQQVMITMERGLLGEVDSYAKRNHISRSELIAAGVKLAMRQRPRSRT